MKKENAQLGAQSVLMSENEYSTTSHMEVFNNTQFGDLSVITGDNDEPWFIANEVTKTLGYQNSSKAISDHVNDEDKGVTKRYTLGGEQEVTTINESGLYDLIYSSKKREAKVFRRWVTKIVLPSIRKHGGYIRGQEQLGHEDKEILAKALLFAKNTIDEKVLENQQLTSAIKGLTQQFVEGQTIPDFCKQFNGVDTQQVMATLARIGYLRDEGYYDVESGRSTHTWRVNSSSRDKHFSEKPSHEYKPGKFSYKITVLKTGAKLLLKLYRTLRLPMKKDWDKKLHHTLPQQ